MESCLTLVRAFYGAQEQMVSDFTGAHPTEDKGRLLSKILAQMMIKCTGEVSAEQIAHLQGFKTNALDFDYRKTGYPELIDIDWEDLKYQPDEESVEGEEEDPNAGKGPVELTPEEALMASEVEDYSDDMKREADLEAREAMGKTQIMFFDISKMGGLSSAVFFLAICAAIGGVFYWFKLQLVPDEPDFNTQRRQKIMERRAAKTKQA